MMGRGRVGIITPRLDALGNVLCPLLQGGELGAPSSNVGAYLAGAFYVRLEDRLSQVICNLFQCVRSSVSGVRFGLSVTSFPS